MRGLVDQRAGDGDALALAAGEVAAVFADQGVVALRHFQDELVRAGEFARPARRPPSAGPDRSVRCCRAPSG